MVEQVTFKGYTESQLRRAFEAVEDPRDWKAPICVTMRGEEVLQVVAAIEFYTATTPRIEVDARTMRYTVTSEGYRAGPAGDH